MMVDFFINMMVETLCHAQRRGVKDEQVYDRLQRDLLTGWYSLQASLKVVHACFKSDILSDDGAGFNFEEFSSILWLSGGDQRGCCRRLST